MTNETTESGSRATLTMKLALAWLAVGVPLLWGVVQTVEKAMALFS
jgi:hypothetical protein